MRSWVNIFIVHLFLPFSFLLLLYLLLENRHLWTIFSSTWSLFGISKVTPLPQASACPVILGYLKFFCNVFFTKSGCGHYSFRVRRSLREITKPCLGCDKLLGVPVLTFRRCHLGQRTQREDLISRISQPQLYNRAILHEQFQSSTEAFSSSDDFLSTIIFSEPWISDSLRSVCSFPSVPGHSASIWLRVVRVDLDFDWGGDLLISTRNSWTYWT